MSLHREETADGEKSFTIPEPSVLPGIESADTDTDGAPDSDVLGGHALIRTKGQRRSAQLEVPSSRLPGPATSRRRGLIFGEHLARLHIGASDQGVNVGGVHSSSIAYSPNCHPCNRISAAQLATLEGFGFYVPGTGC